ncbi:50S ribosomal protein L35 [Streptococcus pneumoniae]|nr:50S ribosomal protein L35 [Streptococcus pneumoniae]
MPKQKTHRASAKRFKRTGSGGLKRLRDTTPPLTRAMFYFLQIFPRIVYLQSSYYFKRVSIALIRL